jgi:hypothetical protein
MAMTESLRDQRQYFFVMQARQLTDFALTLARADDQLAKLEELKPQLTHPQIDDGRIPWIFSAIALSVAGVTPKDLWEGGGPSQPRVRVLEN